MKLMITPTEDHSRDGATPILPARFYRKRNRHCYNEITYNENIG
jgi:hypothetical protein